MHGVSDVNVMLRRNAVQSVPPKQSLGGFNGQKRIL